MKRTLLLPLLLTAASIQSVASAEPPGNPPRPAILFWGADVFESLVQRSKEADIGIGNTGYFSFRNNTSIGSKAFFVGKPMTAAALVTLQGNAIFGGEGTMVEVGNLGPLLLLDNRIQTRRGPAVRLRGEAGLLSVGNTFTCEPAIAAKTNHLAFDDRVVGYDTLKESLPELPARSRYPFLPIQGR